MDGRWQRPPLRVSAPHPFDGRDATMASVGSMSTLWDRNTNRLDRAGGAAKSIALPSRSPEAPMSSRRDPCPEPPYRARGRIVHGIRAAPICTEKTDVSADDG